MPTLIPLADVVGALECATDESTHYLDPDTGEIIMITAEDRRIVEEQDSFEDLPKWQQEQLPKVRAVLDNPRSLQLPDKFDIHEWSIMEDFARDQKSERVRQGLLNAIHNKGAFRAFKNTAHLLGIEQSWYKFRQEALEQIARDWLDEHKLPYK